MGRVIVGVDPHKKSVTIEAVDDQGRVLATGRFGTDKAGYAARRRRKTRTSRTLQPAHRDQ